MAETIGAGLIRIVVDTSRCSGLGLCESVVPDVFEVQDDGHLRVLTESVDASRRAELRQACEACPTSAISLQE